MKIRLSAWMVLAITVLGAVGCQFTGGHNPPPAPRLAEPGPGVGGPGPGVLTPPSAHASVIAQASAVAPATGYEVVSACPTDGYGATTTAPMQQPVQVLFSRPESMQVYWDVTGLGQYDSIGITTPARQSFQQGGIYRLKINNIENREGIDLYPTLEIGPAAHRTAAYLAHSAIPIQFTEEDFNQALSGNFVTKVIYLPDAEFQGLAVSGVGTLVSTRLDPTQDPIVEAQNKGAILAVIRLGNKDMETPDGANTPSTVIPASFATPCNDGSCGSCQGCQPGSGHGLPPGHVSGVTSPQYGMTMSGTPIGLPGPPHIPFGVPAGLQKHVIKNWTRHQIPAPTSKVKINVQQRPGISYPRPANRAWITQENIHPMVRSNAQHYPTSQIHYNCGPNGPCN